jgi:hypothetical protein
VLIWTFVGCFELRQMYKRKLAYFSSFWNFNDCFMLVLSAVTIALDLYFYFNYEALSDSDTDAMQGRMLLKRPKKSSKVVIKEDGTSVVLERDTLVFQFIRICYATLVFTSFFKMLNVAQVFESVGFLVQMLFEICRDSVPFLTFFVYLNVTFGVIFYTVHVPLGDQSIKHNAGEYEGIDDWEFMPFLLFTFRQSLGDFNTASFFFLGKPLLYYTWLMWLICITINSMIFLNFLIATIENVYERIGEAKI